MEITFLELLIFIIALAFLLQEAFCLILTFKICWMIKIIKENEELEDYE